MFSISDMALHAALARRRAMTLAGDATEIAQIDHELAARGVMCVERLAQAYMPDPAAHAR
jgi:hypothetical protein